MTSAEGELFNPRVNWTPAERISEMDSMGMDVQVVSTNVFFYKYDENLTTAIAIARDCNNELHQMTMDYPERLAGLATIPMQDIDAAIMLAGAAAGKGNAALIAGPWLPPDRGAGLDAGNDLVGDMLVNVETGHHAPS